MNRFRPNIVFSGGESYTTRTKPGKISKIGNWFSVIVENIVGSAVYLITVGSGETGEKSTRKPLRTLASYGL